MRYVCPLVGGYYLEVSDTDINGEIIRPTEIRPDKKNKASSKKNTFQK